LEYVIGKKLSSDNVVLLNSILGGFKLFQKSILEKLLNWEGDQTEIFLSQKKSSFFTSEASLRSTAIQNKFQKSEGNKIVKDNGRENCKRKMFTF
jgi:hypothetical protein